MKDEDLAKRIVRACEPVIERLELTCEQARAPTPEELRELGRELRAAAEKLELLALRAERDKPS